MNLFITIFVFFAFLSTPVGADPVTLAVTAFLTSAGFSAAVAAAITTYAVNALISFGVTLVVNALFGSKDNSAVASGITTMVREPTASQKIIYGTRRVSGPIVYIESTGTDGKYLHLVIVLAAHESNAITKVYFDDELAWDGAYQNGWGSFSRLNIHLGSVTQAADADLVSESAGHWTTNHRLQSHTYIYARLLFDQDKFTSGIPNISVILEGRKLYDPRDMSTTFNANPALCLRDYMFDTKHGLGIDADEWNDTDCITLANLSDESITTLDAGTQARFETNAAVDTAANHGAVVESMLVQVLGGLSYIKGQFTAFGAEYRTPTETLTVADLAGPVRLQTAISRRSNYNGVKGRFVSSLNNYIDDEYPAVLSSAYELADGEPQYLSVDFPFETDDERAQRNAKLLLNKSRQRITFSAPFKMSALDVIPGDNVMLTMPRYGWSSKVFEVTGAVPDVGSISPTVYLDLRETASGVYDWQADDADPYLAGPATSLPDPLDITPPTFILSDELRAQGGSVVTALIVDLSGYESVFISKFVIEAKLSTDTEWTTIGSGLQSKFEWLGVMDGAIYDVRARVITLLGARSAYYQKQHTVIGAAYVPADVVGFGIDIIDAVAVLKWNPVADLDLSHYRVKFSELISGAKWSSAIDLSPMVSATTVTVPAKVGTYLIKAVDYGGRESKSATLIVSNVVGLLNLNVVEAVTENPGFAGTLTNVNISANTIVLDDSVYWSTITANWSTITTNWSLVDTYEAAGTYGFDGSIDLGSVFISRINASLEFTRFDTTTLWSQDERIWATVTEWWSGDPDQESDITVAIQIRITDDDPTGSPTWSDWSDLIVGDYTARAMEFRAVLTTTRDKVTPIVYALSVTVDMPDRVYSDNDIATAATAKAVVYSPAFSAIPEVVISGQNMATGDYWTITSKTAFGCTVTFFNSSDTMINRTFDLVAKGYGAIQA